MKKQEFINNLSQIVKEKCDKLPAHDFYHIQRVVNIAKIINKVENANEFYLEIICLLHDVCDRKFFTGDEKSFLYKIMEQARLVDVLTKDEINEIIFNATHISYSKNTNINLLSLEGKIAQDADRLDVIGAIGIARTFEYSGAINQKIYDPDISLDPATMEEYQKRVSLTAVNHFYDKILKVKDTLNTNKAKSIAIEREKFVYKYLDQFFKEWSGKV